MDVMKVLIVFKCGVITFLSKSIKCEMNDSEDSELALLLFLLSFCSPLKAEEYERVEGAVGEEVDVDGTVVGLRLFSC